MKHLFFVFLIFWLGNHSAIGQNYELPALQTSISYFGEYVTHAGIRVGISKTLSQNIKEKDSSKFINKAWVLNGFLTYYKHPRNHSGFMITSAIGRQRTGKKGFQTSINLELGYMLSTLDGEVYEWDGEKIVEGEKGSSHFVFGFNGGFGWNFEKQVNVPISIMILPHFYIQAPYNTLFAPRVALETKLSYHLK